MSKLWAIWLAVVLLCVPAALAQNKGQDQTRSVQGVVSNPDDSPANGAVVYLKNSKTLQVRTFLTKDGGTYYFHGLSPDIDYELRAQSQDQGSDSKTLSSFDSRKQAVVNLKLNKKK